jgi:hypothetical protein
MAKKHSRTKATKKHSRTKKYSRTKTTKKYSRTKTMFKKGAGPYTLQELEDARIKVRDDREAERRKGLTIPQLRAYDFMKLNREKQAREAREDITPKDHHTISDNLRKSFITLVSWWNNRKMEMSGDYLMKKDIIPAVEKAIKQGIEQRDEGAYLFLIGLKGKNPDPSDYENYKKVVNDLLKINHLEDYCIVDESGFGCSISGGKRRSKRRRHHY